MASRQYDSGSMLRARLVMVGALAVVLAAAVAIPVLSGRQTAAAVAGALLLGLLAVVAIAAAAWRAPRAGLGFEWWVHHRFRGVCARRGLVEKVDKPKGGHRAVYPGFGKLAGNRDGFRMVIRPLRGQALADWERATEAFALAYGVTSARIAHAGNGRLVMDVGRQRLDAHEFEHYPVEVAPTGISARQRLGVVQLGTAEGGRPWLLRFLDSHTLIAGITGAGKGSVIWSALLRLVPEVEAGTVRLWGFDPKRMELAIGRGFFHRYASDPEAMVELLELAHDEMHARADALAGAVRRFEPSPEHPLNVLVVDELGYLAGLPDRKLRERAERALTGVLMLGRAVGFSVIGALQDPRKETLGYRDLFPTRVAMRLPKPMVDLVLGHGMYEAGAQCDGIPAGEAGAGVAFVVDEASTQPLCVRASWCSDEAIRAAASRLLPATSTPEVMRLRAVN